MEAAEIAANSLEENGFDRLNVDVAQLYAAYPLGTSRSGSIWTSSFSRFYRNRFLPLRLRQLAWSGLRRSNLDQSWFERFRVYWGRVLGGRPLWGVHDFYFLRNLYRIRFQRQRALPDTDDSQVHLAAWQQPVVLSHLFHSVYKESLFHQLHLIAHLRRAHRPVTRILEFGCGVAPVTTTLVEFLHNRDLQVCMADIETISFHYAGWKMAEFPNVQALPLRPNDGFQLHCEDPFDAIFCMAVFEHLNRPQETIARFHRLLRPGGVLVFDYLKTDASGLDSHQGLRERPDVLQYLESNFNILYGRLDADSSMGVTVAMPKQGCCQEQANRCVSEV